MIMRDPVRHRLTRPAWLIALAVGLLALPAASQRSQAQPEDRPPPESRRREAERREDEDREIRRDGERRVQIEIRRESERRGDGPRDAERREDERREIREGGPRDPEGGTAAEGLSAGLHYHR